MTESDYPYKISKNLNCFYDPKKAKVKVENYMHIDADEEIMKKALVQKGPIAAAVSSKNLSLYKSGIVLGKDCGNDLDHAIVIVGYGNEQGKDYWIIKNSYGNEWGE